VGRLAGGAKQRVLPIPASPHEQRPPRAPRGGVQGGRDGGKLALALEQLAVDRGAHGAMLASRVSLAAVGADAIVACDVAASH
jgi:hypothetical protein